MDDSNKVVVKVKIQGLKDELGKGSGSAPKMVTEWHMGRIITVLAALIGTTLLGLYFLSSEPSSTKVDNTPSIKQIKKDVLKKVIQKKMVQPSVEQAVKKISVKEKSIQSVADVLTKKQPVSATPVAQPVLKAEPIKMTAEKTTAPLVQLSNPNLVRTLLTTELDNKEPVDEISTLWVNKDHASRVFYFTEIIDMKGQVLYHRWLRNNKLIYLKEINIIGKRWRAATSKLIVYSQAGDWTVRLEDAEGVVLNEINFNVIEE